MDGTQNVMFYQYQLNQATTWMDSWKMNANDKCAVMVCEPPRRKELVRSRNLQDPSQTHI